MTHSQMNQETKMRYLIMTEKPLPLFLMTMVMMMSLKLTNHFPKDQEQDVMFFKYPAIKMNILMKIGKKQDPAIDTVMIIVRSQNSLME